MRRKRSKREKKRKKYIYIYKRKKKAQRSDHSKIPDCPSCKTLICIGVLDLVKIQVMIIFGNAT